MGDRDYVLGTHDAEVERLGLQHRVWRPRVLDAWQRAGITAESRVVDFGAGPGYASLDLAEIVGEKGRVAAIERSRRFLDVLEARARHHGLANVETFEADVVKDPLPPTGMDAAWCRWVLSFVTDPQAAVRKLAAMLKPGGVAIFHEYLDYRTWQLMPHSPELDVFVCEVIKSWRESGGEPDIARALPTFLAAAGMEIIALKPIMDVVSPQHFIWQWPGAFIEVNLARQIELGRITEVQAEGIRNAVQAAARNPNALMVTPCVLEIIARKRG